MEVKTEPSDMELSGKYEKLQQDYAKLAKEIADLRKENAELKNEAKKNEKYKQQNAIELTKLKGQNRQPQQQEELESLQSHQKSMMDNSQSSTFEDLPTEETEQNEEFAAETMMMNAQLDHQRKQSQNLTNIIDSIGNASAIIKQEYENAEMGTNCPTSPSLNDEEDYGAEMDLEDEEDENGTSENAEIGGIDEQIKFAPIKIGNIFKCNWPGCEYQNKRLDRMKNHGRTHTGERPYVCEECGKSFTQSHTLKKHALIHSGEKPYQCDVCGKSFRRDDHLVQHKRIHTGERPYVCEECGQSFTQSHTLKYHKLTRHSRMNLDNSVENANTIINVNVKVEYENAEMAANSQFFQMQATTSSTLNMNDDGNKPDKKRMKTT